MPEQIDPAKEFTNNVILNLPFEDEVEFEKTKILDEPIEKSYEFIVKFKDFEGTSRFVAPSLEYVTKCLDKAGYVGYTIINAIELSDLYNESCPDVANAVKALDETSKKLSNSDHTFYKCDGGDYRVCNKTGKIQKFGLIKVVNDLTEKMNYFHECNKTWNAFKNGWYTYGWIDFKIVVTE